MAVINRNSLVLFGVSVVRDEVTGTMGNGIYAVEFQTTTMPFSKRPPSQGFPPAVQEPGQRGYLAEGFSVDSPAVGAGRPGSHPCVLASRPCAITAGRTSPEAWSLAGAGSCSTTGLRTRRLAAWQAQESGNRSQRRLHASHREALGNSIPNRMRAARACKRDGVDLARINPAGGAPPASTRG
jgi:hypothetical protein